MMIRGVAQVACGGTVWTQYEEDGFWEAATEGYVEDDGRDRWYAYPSISDSVKRLAVRGPYPSRVRAMLATVAAYRAPSPEEPHA
ncbi:MAG TPA: hypothetical protein VD970_00965 [Acetobacteraceae bacterium]|nr:hypothetical protein [Acetobacteraceae bacterium]